MGEAADPGPSDEWLDWTDSSSDGENLVEIQRAKGRKQHGKKKCGILSRARKATRKSRARKVGHVVALNAWFLQGFKDHGAETNMHAEKPRFVQEDWQDFCQRLYPHTLTGLLNSNPTTVPKWMLKRWMPFERSPVKQK